jgi:hypothetical protein
MRLKTKRVRIAIPVSDDGSTITVEALKKSELARIIFPCKDFFCISEGDTDEDAAEKFKERLAEAEKEQDVVFLGKLVKVFQDLFRKMVVDFDGLEDEDGRLLVFSDENVEKIIEHDAEFACEFVIPALARLSEEEDRVSKNCWAGSRGSLTPSDPAAQGANGSGSETIMEVAEGATVRDSLTFKTN